MLLDEYSVFAAFCVINAVAIADLSVDANCPFNCHCPQLTVINCSSASLNNATFQHIYYKVEFLDLSRTSLKSVPEALSTYADIVNLNLSSNEISSIRRHAFARMWKLRVLDLSANKIKSLSDIDAGTVFVGNAKLQFLNLSSNPLADLGDEYDHIIYSESLVSLDVSSCHINHIQGPLVLQALPKLTKLNLSSNPLTRLEGLTSNSLALLDLSRCNIQFLRSDSFVGLSELKELHCSGNGHLSDQYYKPVSKSIWFLDASQCAVGTNYASELTEIQTAILKGNQIREIAAYAFHNNTLLERLDLSENIIKSINEFAFYGAESLKHLDLSDNAIVAVSDNTFTFTPFLLTLNLSRNSLRTLDRMKASSVTVLDMSRCELDTIGYQALTNLPSIQVLNVSYNFLENLPENLTSYTLQLLDASYCRVGAVNYMTFYRLQQLSNVNLNGNRLVYLKNNTFSAIPKLSAVGLGNNPWRCDCYDENFKKLWKNLESLPMTEPLLCMYPENVTGQRWDDACSKEWQGAHRRPKDIIILGVIVIVLLVSGVVACVVAIKEGYNMRQNRILEQEQEQQRDNDLVRSDDSENNEIRESVRKFTQLPSYDEALLLPKPPSSSSFDNIGVMPVSKRSENSKKRQSATQTEETIEALLQEIEVDQAAESPERIRRNSIQEIEYINIKPLRLQCTEL